MVLYSLFMFLCLVVCTSKKLEIFKSVIVKIEKEVWINVTTNEVWQEIEQKYCALSLEECCCYYSS